MILSKSYKLDYLNGSKVLKLNSSFYLDQNVVMIAQKLLGKIVYTFVDDKITAGRIVETEAYSWKEQGCHAFRGKTNRNAVMFNQGGVAYVYLCYGIHHLFNIVTNREGIADAVLIRALEPLVGIQTMQDRRGKLFDKYQLTSGPGKLSKALGIDRNPNGKSLQLNEVWIEEDGELIPHIRNIASKRIGIDYAGEDAKLLWRFTVEGSLWLSV